MTVSYGFDGASNLTSLIDKVNGNTIGYAYYTYDVNGRRVEGSGNLGLADINLPGAASATYAADNTLSTWNGTAAGTDGANNLTGDPTNDFAYVFDTLNQLAQVTKGGITQYFMIYGGFGRREQLWSNNGGSLSYTGYLYDGITPVQEQSSSGSKVDSLTMPGSGEVLARTDASGTVAPIYDGTGSTVWLVNSAGAIATQYTYEAYGKTTAALAASSNPFQFTGREHDPSGLYFMRNRYYSPTLLRFVSSDPIGFGGGDVNLFRYVSNDPLNSVDPLGLYGGGGGGGGGGPAPNPPRGPDHGCEVCAAADASEFGIGGNPVIDLTDIIVGGGIIPVQLGGPNPQFRRQLPQPIETPVSRFSSCIEKKLLTGDGSVYLAVCAVTGVVCAYTDNLKLCKLHLAFVLFQPDPTSLPR